MASSSVRSTKQEVELLVQAPQTLENQPAQEAAAEMEPILVLFVCAHVTVMVPQLIQFHDFFFLSLFVQEYYF